PKFLQIDPFPCVSNPEHYRLRHYLRANVTPSPHSRLRVRGTVLKAYLIDSPAGLFLLEKTGKISERALFPHNPSDAAAQLKQVLNAELPPETSASGQPISHIEPAQAAVDGEPLTRL